MKNMPYIIIGSAVVSLIALLALPWVGSGDDTITLLDIIRTKGHGYQVGYAILVPLVVALVVGAASIKGSKRWLTVIAAVLLIVPAFLSAVAQHAALGAHIAAGLSVVALASSVALTAKPIRQ
jgi:hypothetical protein